MVKSKEDAYILGLWCADGYHRTSSFGLSNINSKLIKRFGDFLLERFSAERLRLRVYIPEGAIVDEEIITKFPQVRYLKIRKAQHVAYHIYVNSRSLLRNFIKARDDRFGLKKDFILPYIAGRFDGDGSVSSNLKKDFRIVYGSQSEAESDKRLLHKLYPYRISIYCYKGARTYCLYVSQKDAPRLAKDLLPYSSNLQVAFSSPRRD